MIGIKRYRGSRAVAVPKETVEDALELLRKHDLLGALHEKLSQAKAGFDVRQDGSFATTTPPRSPRNFQAGLDAALDGPTINAFKEVMYSAGLHETDAFAAEIVGVAPGKCPPPTYKCPKAR